MSSSFFWQISPCLVRPCQNCFRSLVEKYDSIVPKTNLFVLLSTNYSFEENNFFINFQFVLLAYCSAGYLFFENCSLCYNLALVWSVGSCGSCKVICPKYSKHWPYLLATTLDYGCSKIWAISFTLQYLLR